MHNQQLVLSRLLKIQYLSLPIESSKILTMLNRSTSIPIILAFLFASSAFRVQAQCPGGYTSAQLNWDNLDYYWNSGGGSNTPYNNYISDAREQNQKFAFGTTSVAIVTSNAAMVNPGVGASGENATHTGNIANYAGEDVQYNPSANGQTITMTFASAVSAPNFTLYDIDANAVITVTATNNLGAATAVNVTTYAGTILTVGILPLARTVTANATALANTLNTGSATITVPGLVNTIKITVTTIGTDPVFWLSDINACVPGTFPTNWHQGANNRPFWGPTQSQPDYFLLTPDNNSVYMIDPVTGIARELFADAAKTYVNSFGYDPYNLFLYYISENVSVDPNNKQIKRYNYNTETSSVVIADITAAPLNIPTFNSGVESAGCAFYNGSLYFGIEGGTSGSSGSLRTRETIIWKIDFDASNNPISACQVFATDAATNGSGSISIHDWGDFIIKNGMLYDFNTARNSGCGSSCYNQSKYHHFNMMTGNLDALYSNPGTAVWNGQAGMNWAQQLYYFRPSTGTNSVVGEYDEAGNSGTPTTITVAAGPAWPGGSGDGSDPFRPKCDFGDAPASYDPYVTPATQSPAVHERADTMWLGTTTSEATSWDREFFKKGTNGTADTDNGVSTVPFLKPGNSDYLVQASLYNNSSGNATAIAWLDFNGNGTFEAAEAAQVYPAGAPIPPGGAVVTRYFYWPNITTPLTSGSYTYLRIRITATAAGMTTSHPTGYFTKGEVEDYRVPVDNFPLATHLLNFDAGLQNKKVTLTWNATEDAGVYSYEIERSADNTTWNTIGSVAAHGTAGTFDYQTVDPKPLKGISYYRLKIIESSGMNRYSPIKPITFTEFNLNLTIAPNPAKDKTSLLININEANEAAIEIVNMQGRSILKRSERLNTGNNTIEFPLDAFVSGVYIVRIAVGNEVIHQKLIINK